MLEAGRPSRSPGKRPRLNPVKLRLVSGLVLFTFAATHFINHSLGLISFDLMQTVQDGRTFITRSWPGTTLLVGAAAVHFVLGC